MQQALAYPLDLELVLRDTSLACFSGLQTLGSPPYECAVEMNPLRSGTLDLSNTFIF